jgi:hypothetical protein
MIIERFGKITPAYNKAIEPKSEGGAKVIGSELFYIVDAANTEYREIAPLLSKQPEELTADDVKSLKSFAESIELMNADNILAFMPKGFDFKNPPKLGDPKTKLDLYQLLVLRLIAKYYSVRQMIEKHEITNGSASTLDPLFYTAERKYEDSALYHKLVPGGETTYTKLSEVYVKGVFQEKASTLDPIIQYCIDLQIAMRETPQSVLESLKTEAEFRQVLSNGDPQKGPIGLFLLLENYYKYNLDQFIVPMPTEINEIALLGKINATLTAWKNFGAEKFKADIAAAGTDAEKKMLAVKTFGTTVDLIHRARDKFNSTLAAANRTGKDSVLDMTKDLITAITSVAEKMIIDADKTFAKKDVSSALSAYQQYEQAQTLLNSDTWGLSDTPAGKTLKDVVTRETDKTRQVVVAKIKAIDDHLDEMKATLASPTATVEEKIKVLNENQAYMTLYEKKNNTTEVEIFKAIIGDMAKPTDIILVLESEPLKKITKMINPRNSELLYPEISAAVITKATEIVTAKGFKGDLDELTALKKSIEKNQSSLPGKGTADLLKTLALLISQSSPAPRLAKSSIPTIPTSTSVDGGSVVRPTSGSEQHYDVPMTDLSTLTGNTPIGVGTDITTISAGAGSLYDAATSGGTSQFLDGSSNLVAIYYNGQVYLIDSNGIVTGVADPSLYTIENVNGVITITFNNGTPQLEDSGATVAQIAGVPIDATAPAVAPTTTPLVLSTSNATGASIIYADGTTEPLTIDGDGNITLTEKQLKDIYYNNGLLTVTGDNGSSSLSFIDIVGEENYTAPTNPDGYSVKFDTSNPYSILNADIAPSAALIESGKAGATGTVKWGGTTISLPPLTSYAGAFKTDGTMIYGHGTISVTIVVATATGTTTKTILVQLPDEPPIFKAVRDGLPTSNEVSYFWYKFGVLTSDALLIAQAKENEKPEASRSQIEYFDYLKVKGMDGLRIKYNILKANGKDLSTFSSIEYLLFDNVNVQKAKDIISAQHMVDGKPDPSWKFSEADLPTMIALTKLIEKFPGDAVTLSSSKKAIADYLKVLYSDITITAESEFATLLDVAKLAAQQIVIKKDETYMISSSDLANADKGGISLSATIAGDYDKIDSTFGKIEPYAKLNFDWNTAFNRLSIEMKYAQPFVTGGSGDAKLSEITLSDISFSVKDVFGTPEFQGFVSIGNQDLVSYTANQDSSYWRLLAGVQGSSPLGRVSAGEIEAAAFTYQFGTGIQWTSLSEWGIQALCLPILGEIGLNIGHMRLALGADFLVYMNDNLGKDSVYAKDPTGPDFELSSTYVEFSSKNFFFTDPYFTNPSKTKTSFPMVLSYDFAQGTASESGGISVLDGQGFSWGANLLSSQYFSGPWFAPREFDFSLGANGFFTFSTGLKIFGAINFRDIMSAPKPSLSLGVTIPIIQ